jgi:S-methylmethionine-dependent homocysteine/selenocysteine methylase
MTHAGGTDDVRGRRTARYRHALPQLGGDLFLADGGIETSVMAGEGLQLTDFAVFPLLGTAEGQAALRRYFRSYAEIARRHGAGLVLESATWRASAGWGARLGFSAEMLEEIDRKAIRLLEDVRDEFEGGTTRIVISGCVGPRHDGYDPAEAMSEGGAEAYHAAQIATFADTAADMVAAITLTNAEEAVGIARAAARAGMPVAISFTVETDGRLATRQTLQHAIEAVDEATSAYPSYYMINCAHPAHFRGALVDGEPWVARIRGLRANASRLSHAELEETPEPDAGEPAELGREYAELKRRLPQLSVLGGCCGTDCRHIGHIATACAPLFRDAT